MSSSLAGHENVLLVYQHDILCSFHEMVVINIIWQGLGFFSGFFLAVLSQQREQCYCRKECSESVSKLQKKNQELQRHLEKTCRQLQHSVREHKTAIQHLKGSAFKRPY